MAKHKKRFLDSIGAALRENVVEEVVLERKLIPKKKLGFLNQLGGDLLDSDALGEVMPTREMLKNKPQSQPKLNRFAPSGIEAVLPINKKALKMVDYSTQIYTELLEKLRDVASARNCSINELFNEAMKQYVDKYWDISMMGEE